MNAQSRNLSAPTLPRPAGTPAAAVAKAGVCVALVAAIAWIASSPEGTRLAATVAKSEVPTPAAMTMTGDRAAAHRQRIFDERRARFSARTDAQVARNDVSAVQAP